MRKAVFGNVSVGQSQAIEPTYSWHFGHYCQNTIIILEVAFE